MTYTHVAPNMKRVKRRIFAYLAFVCEPPCIYYISYFVIKLEQDILKGPFSTNSHPWAAVLSAMPGVKNPQYVPLEGLQRMLHFEHLMENVERGTLIPRDLVDQVGDRQDYFYGLQVNCS